MTPQETVQAFIAGWNRMGIPAALAMMSEDAVWHKIPVAPASGMDEIAALIAQFLEAEVIEFVTHHIAVTGNAVLTERTDQFFDWWTLARPLRDGRIRDRRRRPDRRLARLF